MNILDTIIQQKKIEVATSKAAISLQQLEQSAAFKRPIFSLKNFLLNENTNGIIAEFKRKSPSKGIINNTASVLDVTNAYVQNGASALSILTDEYFFGGSPTDIAVARVHAIPILRKDFVIDAYQIAEARAMGADVILLIAACLSPTQVKELATYATNIGLEVLLELHSEQELEHICAETNIIGINNRNLKTFEVDINTAIALSKKIPAEKIKIAESGIHNIETIRTFKQEGYHGFLIGENFMKQPNPAIAFAQFVQSFQSANG
jgi:indole-3-glycerol phosphate synthase